MEKNNKIQIIDKVKNLNLNSRNFYYVLGKRFVFAMLSAVHNSTLRAIFVTDGEYIYDLRHSTLKKYNKPTKYSGTFFKNIGDYSSNIEAFYLFLRENHVVLDEVVNADLTLKGLFQSKDKISTNPIKGYFQDPEYIEVTNKNRTIRYPYLNANGKKQKRWTYLNISSNK